MHVLTPSEVLAGLVAMIVLELYHLKWIWLSEWSCAKCSRRNLDCGCSGRWTRYL
jgi:hypothetical protein